MSGESTSTRENATSLLAILLAVVAIVIVIVVPVEKTANNARGIFEGIGITVIALLWFAWKFLPGLARHSNIARYLLCKIMEEGLRDPLEVETKWKEYRKDEKKGWEKIQKEEQAKKRELEKKKK